MRGRIVSSPSSAASPRAEQLYLYYPSRRLQPAGFQALLDAVKAAVDCRVLEEKGHQRLMDKRKQLSK